MDLFERLIGFGAYMSLHSATWRVHASSLDDLVLIEDSIKWIAGEDCEILIDKDRAMHGALQTTIVASIKNKKQSRESLTRLGEDTLIYLLQEDISSRIDENKNMHIRLNVADLVREKISVSSEDADNLIAKGVFKIECYPGDTPERVITEMIEDILEREIF